MKKRVILTITISDIPDLPGEEATPDRKATFDTQSGKITIEGDMYPAEHRMCSDLTGPAKFFVREQERFSNLKKKGQKNVG